MVSGMSSVSNVRDGIVCRSFMKISSGCVSYVCFVVMRLSGMFMSVVIVSELNIRFKCLVSSCLKFGVNRVVVKFVWFCVWVLRNLWVMLVKGILLSFVWVLRWIIVCVLMWFFSIFRCLILWVKCFGILVWYSSIVLYVGKKVWLLLRVMMLKCLILVLVV